MIEYCQFTKTAVCFKCHYEWQTRTNVVSRLRCPKCKSQNFIGLRCPGVTIMVCRKAEDTERAASMLAIWTGQGADVIKEMGK